MWKNVIYAALLLSLSSCFKEDVFELEKSGNFLETDFYKNEFQSFELVVEGVQYFDPIPNLQTSDTSYAFSITYGLSEDFYEGLRAEWPYDIVLSRLVNATLQLDDEHLVEEGRFLFTDTIGRRNFPSNYKLNVELQVKSPRGVMASQVREESLVLNP